MGRKGEAAPGPLPVVPGHFPGDMHVHSDQFGDDGRCSIAEQAATARGRGLAWLALTPHAQKMDPARWDDFVGECRRVARKEGIVVSAGLEVSTRCEYRLHPAPNNFRAPRGERITSWEAGCRLVPIGFPFPFYGVARQSLYVSRDGFVTFAAPDEAHPSVRVRLPDPAAPRALIAPFWHRLAAEGGGEVWLDRGVPGELHVTWLNVVVRGTGNRLTFQLRLKAGGDMYFYYRRVDWPRTPTAGIQDDRGEYGVPYTGALRADTALAFHATFDSHCLGHGLSSFIVNGAPETRTGGEIIAAITGGAGRPGGAGGFATLAHPGSWAYPWRYWTRRDAASDGTAYDVRVTGMSALELLTGDAQTQASQEIVARWDALLSLGLDDALAGRGFVAGLAGSDDHHYGGLSLLGSNITWARAAALDEGAALAALRTGRAFASADGSLTTFTVEAGGERWEVGSVVRADPDRLVTLRGTIHPARGSRPTGVQVYRNGALEADLEPRGANWSCAAGVARDCYFRVELVTRDDLITYRSYSNPIFVRA